MTGPVFAWEGQVPRIAGSAWIAPGAVVIGDVEIGENASVWFNCTVRGDTSAIRIGARTNVQDGTVLHVTGTSMPCIIGDDVTIGHGAIVHAATLRNRAFVGMGSVVLDGALIEERGMLAAGGLLAPGKVIAAGELWGGSPARLMRRLSDDDLAQYAQNAAHYVALAQRFKSGLKPAPVDETRLVVR